MENYTILQLKAIATERGIRGYYKLRKAELIHVLEATRLVEQKITPSMSRFQTIPLQFYNQNKQNIKNFAAKNMEKTKKFLYYGYAKD